MTVQDMDICLNISSNPASGNTKKVQQNKANFFKPHVKRLAKKSQNIDKKKNDTSENITALSKALNTSKNNSKNTRIKQKSLSAIVAKNVARSKTLIINKNTKINRVKEQSQETKNALLSTAKNEKISLRNKIKPVVSFVETTKENAPRTIVAKVKNDPKSKKSLSDIFGKKSGGNDVSRTKLSQSLLVNEEHASDLGKRKKLSVARNVLTEETEKSRFGDRNKKQNRRDKVKTNLSNSDEKQENPARFKPSRKFFSLFGNNPEVPNFGQRLVKPINEAVFGESTFQDLGIHPYAVSNLEQNMGIKKATTVQQKAIPVVALGKDVLIRSQTGSGKTLSYALPIVETLHKITPKLTRNSGLKALIVVPTRELALQTYECFVKLVKPFNWIVAGYLVGGEKRKAEKARLRKGCSILIATPGRLLDHVKHTLSLKLDNVRCFVLDEADRMLDMGYEKDISAIVEALDKYSATTVESSYDPLAMVRNSKKIFNDENENSGEKIADEQKVCKNDFSSEDEDSSTERKTLEKSEYHSGTDSDDDDDDENGREFCRTKKIKKDPVALEKPRRNKDFSKASNDNNEKSIDGTSKNSRQTILLSATLTSAVEKLAGLTMTDPVFVDAAQDNLNEIGSDSKEINEDLVVPQGVAQSYIVTPPKLRMVTLSAYIAGKCQVAGQHKILVFMATQDMIDYHADILSTVLGQPSNDDDDDSEPLVDVEFFKLHGNMSQKERTEVFKTFRKSQSGVLLCTDVAARGLDMPKVDTVVQYTGPLSARDYVHRIGRTARAGTSGVSTIFLTPSEIDFVRLLESRRIRIKQVDMNDVLDKLMGPLSKHNTVEATATALQNQFETLVLEDKKFHEKACKAYVSWMRFYSSYPRDMREIFNRKDLHLGHYAKSFALRDPPQRIGGIGKSLRDKEPSKAQHNNRLANDRPVRQPQKRHNLGSGHKPELLKKSRMLNTSEYGSGLEPIKKSKKSG